MTKYRETVYQDLPTVDNGVLRGVRLLGLTSRNGRRYESAAVQKAVSLYEGKKVYVNHPRRDDDNEDRAWGDWAGVVENVSFRKNEGLFGDVVLRQKSDYFEGIVEVASNPKFRKNCGFSHVAEGASRLEKETEIVESIESVYSVDLVTDPATTSGIFESIQTRQVESLRETVGKLPDGELRSRLTEMADYMGGMPIGGNGSGAASEQPADHVSQLVSILRDTVAALADSLKSVAKANKPAAPVIAGAAAGAAAGDKPNGDKPGGDSSGSPFGGDEATEDEGEDDMTPEDKEKIAAYESVQRELAEQKAKNLLLESQRDASKARIKALANCADDNERQELLESWPTIHDSTRPNASPGRSDSITDFPRDNTEKFAALLR